MTEPSSDHDPISDGRFRELLDGVQKQDPDACKAIVEEYGDHLIRAVRRYLNNDTRNRADSQDFAQSVWGAFFGQECATQDFKDEEHLISFLARIASNKVIDAGRRRRVRRERTLSTPRGLRTVLTDHRRKISQDTPSEIAVANERWSQLNEDVSELVQTILTMLRDGSSHVDIAAKTGVTPRHIGRIVSKLEKERARKVTERLA